MGRLGEGEGSRRHKDVDEWLTRSFRARDNDWFFSGVGRKDADGGRSLLREDKMRVEGRGRERLEA